MDLVLRALAIYLFLLLVFRISGKRSLAQITTFDFVLLLIIAETTQQGLVGELQSVTGALVLIVTLISIDIGISLIKQRSRGLDAVLESKPLVLLEDGKPYRERLARERVSEDDILEAARELQGLEHLRQIRYAVLERNGDISIVPKAS